MGRAPKALVALVIVAGIIPGVQAAPASGRPAFPTSHNWTDCSYAGPPSNCHVLWHWSSSETEVTLARRPSYQAQPSAWQSRVFDARDSWPYSTGRPAIQIQDLGTATVCPSSSPATGKINLHYAQTDLCGGDAGTWAATGTNVNIWSFTLDRADIVIDVNYFWYSGTGATVPSGEVDLWGVMAHELGHALGWYGHFDLDDPSTYCDTYTDEYRHTMCSGGVDAADYMDWSSHSRSIEFLDYDVIDSRY